MPRLLLTLLPRPGLAQVDSAETDADTDTDTDTDTDSDTDTDTDTDTAEIINDTGKEGLAAAELAGETGGCEGLSGAAVLFWLPLLLALPLRRRRGKSP